MSKPGGGLVSKIILGLVVVALLGVLAGGVQIWRKHQARKRQHELATMPLKPCEDPRPQMQDADPVPGLEPNLMLFSSKCEWLAVSAHFSNMVFLIRRQEGRVRSQVRAHDLRTTAILFTPDDEYLFTAKMTKGEIAVWKTPELEEVMRFSTGAPGSEALAWDAANGVLLTGGSQQLLGWKLDFAGRVPPSQPVLSAGANGVIHALAISEDGKFIGAAASGSITVWGYDGATSRVIEVATLRPSENVREASFVALAFSKDNKYVAAVRRRFKNAQGEFQKGLVGVWTLPDLKAVAPEGAEWVVFQDPGKISIGGAKPLFALAGHGADFFYSAWDAEIPGFASAFRGSVAATGHHGDVLFWSAFGPPDRTPILKVHGVHKRRER